jgi:xylulose-5-phosphate/fructose-6-phosphate phosphoketolase
MRVKNKLDRFNLVIDAVNNLELGLEKDVILNDMNKKLSLHNEYIVEVGEDLPEIKNWKFSKTFTK